MKNMMKSVLTCIILMVISITAVMAQNLITNGSFEDGINTWVTSSSGGSTAAFEIYTSDVHTGSNALKIDISSLGTSAKDVSITKTGFSVQKDIVYLLSFWAKSDSTGKPLSVLFSATATSSYLPYDSSIVLLSTEWKKYEVVFPSPITTASDIQFSIQFGYGKGMILLDDIAVEKKGNSWYEGAEYRIEKYRKGNFGVKIINSSGDPVSDSVIIRQTKHEFPWGTSIDLNDKPTGSNYTSPQAITAPSDSEIYRIERYAAYLPYILPAISGKKYQLTVKMSENYFNAANSRLFDLYVDGTRLIKDLDKFVKAGSRYKACDSTVKFTAIDSIIKLEFLASKDNAAIMGLVLADSAGNPILRLNCSPSKIITHNGNTYLSDLPYIDMYASQPNTSNDDFYKAAMLKYCNFGVCGNQFKWSGIEPTKGVLNYAPFDNTLGWFNKVGWDMRAHTLLWGGTSSTDYHELPQWVGQLPPAVMYDTCKMRIQRELTRYKGKVKEYDVINEPLHANYLQSQVGDSINWNCFKWAREADPDARLYINDYNIFEYQGDCDNFTTLMQKLLDKGAPIDGIGSQAHFGTTIDVPSVKSRIDKLWQFGIPIKVTEFDMAAAEMTQQEHADEFAKMMRLSFSHPAIDGFIIWSLFDPGWRATVSNLIGTDKAPKLVADSVYHLIHEQWNTTIPEKTDTSGKCFYRGFYGDYDVMVKSGGTWQKFNIVCNKENEGELFTLKETNGMPLSPVLMKVKNIAPVSVELTFDKKMTDPGIDYKNFKVFDTLTNAVKSAILKPGDSTTIVLTMKSNFKAGYYVPVSYFPGSIKSADGGILEAFGPALDNRLTPAFIAAKTTKNGKAIAVNFKDPIDLASANVANFSVKVNNVVNPLTVFSLSSTKDTLYAELTNQIISNVSTIKLNYNPGSLITADSLSITAFINKNVTNTIIVPAMQSASTTKDGSIIQIKFAQNIDNASINISDFSVTVNDAEIQVTSGEVMSSSKKTVALALETPVVKDASVNIVYTPGSLVSIDEIPVPAFNTTVVNKVTTDIKGISSNIKIQLFPNPVNDWLNITNATNYQTVTIANITGQEIYTTEIPSTGVITINTKIYEPGIYLIILKNNEGKSIFKFVKQ